MKAHTPFIAIGKELLSYGANHEQKLDAFIKDMPSDRRTLCLLTAMLNELITMNKAIGSLPSRMAKAQLAEERALEKEKQKTARAQEKANAALPPVVTELILTTDEIEEAVGNGRVRRRF